MYVCVSVCHLCMSAHGGQKMASDPLELEYRCEPSDVGAGTPLVLCKISIQYSLLTAELSLLPHLLYL